jgi:ribosomal protein L14
MWWLVAALAAGALVGAVVVRRRSAARRPDGLQSFRKHMDALSSDARQNVIGRVRDADARSRGSRDGT